VGAAVIQDLPAHIRGDVITGDDPRRPQKWLPNHPAAGNVCPNYVQTVALRVSRYALAR